MNTHESKQLRPGPVVVGVDELANAGQAVRWAAEQASLEGRPVLLVHAATLPTGPWSLHQMAAPVDALGEVRRAGHDLLNRARDVVHAVDPSVRVDDVLEVSDARHPLLQYADRAGMVVLGSHGRGPTLSHLLGSVGVHLVRHAPCPVVVHRPGHPGRVHDGIMAAVDATADAALVLEHAFQLASRRRLPLRVLHHVMDDAWVAAGVPMAVVPSDGGEQDAVDLAEAMAGLRELYPDVRVFVERTRGVPEQDLAAQAVRADLLVVGTRQPGLLERVFLPSVAVSVVERATCPVMVVPTVSGRA